MVKDYSDLREEDSLFLLEMYLSREGLVEMWNGKFEFTRHFLRRDEIRGLNFKEIAQKEKEAKENLKNIIKFLNDRNRTRAKVINCEKNGVWKRVKRLIKNLFPKKYLNFEGTYWN